MWSPKKIDELKNKRETVMKAGGDARIQKQHESGKLTALERMLLLFDKDTFTQINDMRESQATDFGMEKKRALGDGGIVGYGKVNGRTVFASSQDFTVSGGSLGKAHAEKICRVMDMAMDVKAPFVSINDSGGARIEEGIDSLHGYAEIFLRNTKASGVIPQISVIMGPCAGGACYSPAICDFIFMTEQTSQMYITGPQVVKAVLGEEISAKELGGAQVHSAGSGVAQFVYPNDKECIEGVRKLIDYIPQNNEEYPPEAKADKHDGSKKLQDIVDENSRKVYNVKDVIAEIIDKNSFFEVQPDFAKNIVVGFARIAGKTVGIVANQPNFKGGSLDVDSSDKAARFIRFCDCFNISLLSLVDVPAFMPGREQEHNGIIRHGAQLLFAYAEATVPKVCLIMRKAYGGAYIAMNSKGIGADIVFAWPIAEIAVMGADGAVNIIGRKEVEAAADKAAKRAELIAQYSDKFMNPYVAASRGYVDLVIMPEETREKIISAFDMLEFKEKSLPNKKHGNIPL